MCLSFNLTMTPFLRLMVRGDDQQQEQIGGEEHELECRWSEDLYRVRGRGSDCWFRGR